MQECLCLCFTAHSHLGVKNQASVVCYPLYSWFHVKDKKKVTVWHFWQFGVKFLFFFFFLSSFSYPMHSSGLHGCHIFLVKSFWDRRFYWLCLAYHLSGQALQSVDWQSRLHYFLCCQYSAIWCAKQEMKSKSQYKYSLHWVNIA